MRNKRHAARSAISNKPQIWGSQIQKNLQIWRNLKIGFVIYETVTSCHDDVKKILRNCLKIAEKLQEKFAEKLPANQASAIHPEQGDFKSQEIDPKIPGKGVATMFTHFMTRKLRKRLLKHGPTMEIRNQRLIQW